MTKRAVAIAAVLTLALGGAVGAQVKPEIVNKPAPYVSPSDPPGMFQEYCAPCHGKAGRGDGPAVPALKAVPANLTTLSARNGGKFPEARVRRYIEGLDEISAHGSRDMPIWGRALRTLPGGDAGMRLRIESLTRHVESLQQK